MILYPNKCIKKNGSILSQKSIYTLNLPFLQALLANTVRACVVTVLSKELTGTAATADLLSAAHSLGEGVLVGTRRVPRQEEDSAGALLASSSSFTLTLGPWSTMGNTSLQKAQL